jgi:hypothetical protein
LKTITLLAIIAGLTWASSSHHVSSSSFSHAYGVFSVDIEYIDEAVYPQEEDFYPADRFDPSSTDLCATQYGEIRRTAGHGEADISFNFQDGNYTFDLIYFNDTWAFLDGELRMLIDGSLVTFDCSPDRDVTDGGSCREWLWFDPDLATIRRIAGAQLVELQMQGENRSFTGELSQQTLLDLRYFLSIHDPESGYTAEDFPVRREFDLSLFADSLFCSLEVTTYLDSVFTEERTALREAHASASDRNFYNVYSFARDYTIEIGEDGFCTVDVTQNEGRPGQACVPDAAMTNLLNGLGWLGSYAPAKIRISITASFDPEATTYYGNPHHSAVRH